MSRRRRVLIAPQEVAGVGAAMRDGLRGRGVQADLWVLREHPFFNAHDRLVSGYAQRALAGLEAPLRYDVLHFQFGTTLAEFLDVAWSRIARRPPVLMHYWGGDARIRTGGGLVPIGADAVWEREQRAVERIVVRRLRLAGRLCDAALVPDLELAYHVRPYFRTIYVLPMPITLPLELGEPSALNTNGDGPVAFHAPSKQIIKGTAPILRAMEAVASRRPLQVVTVTGRPRSTVLADLARADIVIDQLNQETTGVLALEAMALGKPVLTQLRREWMAPFARDVPVVPVTADTLEDELEALAGDPARREALGRAGREHVARVHAASVVAGLLEAVYDDVRTRGAGTFEVTPNGIVPLPSAAR